ncbi:MobA/MobL family protein [Microvirga brassicacearum]|uniref:MobA/MobL family protein n=1 Tax=Microvirga brassicacearum TaxID=2580413 RepID=UPI001390FA80|nr:MobA/MobL family protein [Microvirga brassicacearum]
MALKSSIGSIYSNMIHQAVASGYHNPSVRFGDLTKTSSRPKSADGATSFHFSHSFQSKTSPIQQLIREFHGGRKYSNSKATDHLLYIEREGVAEKLKKSKNPFEEMEQATANRSSNDQQDYLERLGAVERVRLKNLSDGEIGALEYASFGTIGETLQERHHFWNEVEKLEQDPRGDKITLPLREHPRWWDLVLSNIELAPQSLRSKLADKKAGDPAEDIVLTMVPTKKAFEIYKWASNLNSEIPIDIEPGRGGRVQTRIIAELPFELEAEDRIRIVRNFTDKLTENDLPFWAVIHAPDKNNDKRNFHVHIVYYDRPCAKMKDPTAPNGAQVWDFAIREETIYKNYTRRVTNPYAQNKSREASGKDWISKLRAHWEQVSNKVMEDVGLEKRYDRRTYKEMGIQIDPLKHIPSKTFNKERKGELTDEGVVLARRQWDNVRDEMIRVSAKRTLALESKVTKKAAKAQALLLKGNPHKEVASKEIKRIRELATGYAKRVARAELLQDLTRVVVDRTTSRAKLIVYDAMTEQGKKKRGRPRKNPVANATNGATLPLGEEAIEASEFVSIVLKSALTLDGQWGAEVRKVQHHLYTLMDRMDHFIKNPKQHPLDPRQPGYVDLKLYDFDPEEVKKLKEERMERVQASLNVYIDKAKPEIIKAVELKMKELEKENRAAGKQEPSGESIPSPSPSVIAPVGVQMDSSVPASSTPVEKPAEAKVQAPPAPERGTRARFRFEPFPKPAPRVRDPAFAPTKPAPASKPSTAAAAPSFAGRPATTLGPTTTNARPLPATPPAAAAAPNQPAKSVVAAQPSVAPGSVKQPVPSAPRPNQPTEKPAVVPAPSKPTTEPSPGGNQNAKASSPVAPVSKPVTNEKVVLEQKPISKPGSTGSGKPAVKEPEAKPSVTINALPIYPITVIPTVVVTRREETKKAPSTEKGYVRIDPPSVANSKPEGLTISTAIRIDATEKKNESEKDGAKPGLASPTPAANVGQPSLPGMKKPEKRKKGPRRDSGGPEL